MIRTVPKFLLFAVFISFIIPTGISNSRAFEIPDLFNFKSAVDCASDPSNADCMKLPEMNININKIAETKSFSTSDLIDMLKAIAVLAINVFLVIINTVAGILKALLPFLK